MKKIHKKSSFNLRNSIEKSVIILFLLLTNACNSEDKSKIDLNAYDLPRIMKSGKLTVLIENSSSSFFYYKGKKMGFEFDILQEFCQDLGVKLDIKVVSDLDEISTKLKNHEGDLLACHLSVNKDRKQSFDFTDPILRTPQVLVQRKKNDSISKNGTQYISEPLQLARRKVDVWGNSSYFLRLKNLQEEIGDSIYIRPTAGFRSTEELIEMVAMGEIDYTIAEKSVAQINENFYDNIDISVKVSFNQNISFGINRESILLKKRFNSWLKKFKSNQTFAFIKKKYFEKGSSNVLSSTDENITLTKGSISPFDNIMKSEAGKQSIDWRFVAAIISKESNFNPTVVGFGGSYGLMQFMPGVGPNFGVYPSSTPTEQIRGGIKFIKKLESLHLKVASKEERMKFMLASYNAGPGHVLDAQNLARKNNLNPYLWDGNVETMLGNLSKKEFYSDPVVKTGSFRGVRTVNYVKSIIQKYSTYKQMTQ